jgi:hypothetical protein
MRAGDTDWAFLAIAWIYDHDATPRSIPRKTRELFRQRVKFRLRVTLRHELPPRRLLPSNRT